MDPLQLVATAGAAGAFIWVLSLLTGGKLHTSSETDGLRQDKVDLLKVNDSQAKALKASNEQQTEIVKLLREVLSEIQELRGPSGPS